MESKISDLLITYTCQPESMSEAQANILSSKDFFIFCSFSSLL